MLLHFSVENFMSIKDEMEINFTATTDKSLPENILEYGSKRYLKEIAMYGANASGKSNVMKALFTAIMTVRLSDNRGLGNIIPGMIPFKFDDECVNKPTVFKFTFVTNGVKYFYAFAATLEKIVYECLYVYSSSKPSKIFERKEGEKYSFPATLKGRTKLMEIQEKNTPNKLFLATATNWNSEETRPAFMWFKEGIDIIGDYNGLMEAPAWKEYLDNEELKKFTLELVSHADINIDDYAVKLERKNIDELQVPAAFAQILRAKGEDSIDTTRVITGHTILKKGKKMKVQLNMQEESLGTQTLFALAPILNRTLKKGSTLFIDEIEKSLHPLLVRYLIGLFNNPEYNKKGAQLMFITHDVSLMDLELLRRDQFYFVEKDRKTAASEVFSLGEFSVRKFENIRKAYLAGRFGAIPRIG